LPLNELFICLGFSSLVFVWVEIEKFVYRLYRSRQFQHSLNSQGYTYKKL